MVLVYRELWVIFVILLFLTVVYTRSCSSLTLSVCNDHTLMLQWCESPDTPGKKFKLYVQFEYWAEKKRIHEWVFFAFVQMRFSTCSYKYHRYKYWRLFTFGTFTRIVLLRPTDVSLWCVVLFLIYCLCVLCVYVLRVFVIFVVLGLCFTVGCVFLLG